MKLKEYIKDELNIKKKTWTVINLNDIDQDVRHRLWDMYVDTYSVIGLHIESASKLTSKYKVSWMIDTDKDPDPDAFIIYKETKSGNKIAILGSDGKKENKKMLLAKVLELLKTKGWYIEASHKLADILEAKGIKIFKDVDQIKNILGKKDVTSAGDEGVYKRRIGSLGMIKKRLFGNIK